MTSTLKIQSIVAGTTISLACAFGFAGCSGDSSAGELLDAATKTLKASGFEAEKGLSYTRQCYAPDPHNVGDMLAGSGGCRAIFTGIAVKDAARYDVGISCETDAKTAGDCRISRFSPV